MKKKLFCLIAAAVMLLSALPMGAFAQPSAVRDAAREDAVLAYWDFETDPLEDGWQFIDADGDGENWSWVNSGSNANSGTHAIMSASDTGSLHPDHWAITPAVAVPAQGYTTFRYYGKNYVSSFQDNYRIYIGTSDDIASMEPLTEDRVFIGNQYASEEVDITAFAGQTVFVAIRHYNVSDEWRFYFDDISFVNSDEAPEAPVETFSFNSEAELADWTFVDSDGDGHNWSWSANYPEDLIEYEGVGALYSESYVNDYEQQTGYAVTPDNWAVSPSFTVPDENARLTLYAASYGNYGNEHFAVYAGTSPDIESMVEVLPETEATAQILNTPNYRQYEADLSAFAGQDMHIAVRHFNCTDFFILMLDKIEIWGSYNAEPGDPYAIHEVYVNGWTDPIEGVAGIDNVFLETPEGAPYYIVYAGWRDETDQQQMWNENHVFVAGHEYSEGCQIWAEEGYHFAEDCAFYADGDTLILDLEWCYVDEMDNWICYMNSIPTVCEAASDTVGDIDLDGDVDTADAILALRYVLGLDTLSSVQLENADVDGDGSVTIIDCVLVHRRAMGVIPAFPVE